MYKIDLKKKKQYKLCTCGVSKSLPFCDDEHRNFNKKNNTEFKSLKITSDYNVSIKVESKKWNQNE